MKVLRRGRWPRGRRTFTCEDCGCEFGIEDGDELRLVTDQRDGNYYEVPCPDGCGRINAVAAELLDR